MRQTNSMPCLDFVPRPDAIEADYAFAATFATQNQARIEAAALVKGQTVDAYMTTNGMLTDSNLTPWARSQPKALGDDWLNALD